VKLKGVFRAIIEDIKEKRKEIGEVDPDDVVRLVEFAAYLAVLSRMIELGRELDMVENESPKPEET
jgi:hypothetical protein